AAGAVQQPHLRALLLFVLVAARGEEGQVLAVRAPAGLRLVVLAGSELPLLLAVPAHHPEVAIGLVLLGVRRPHGVGHPLAVGRALGVGDGPDLREVVEGERAGLGRRRGRCDEQGSQNGCESTWAWHDDPRRATGFGLRLREAYRLSQSGP